MDIKEAIDILDATLGMFCSFADEIENGELKDKFLSTPVFSCVENSYNDDGEFVVEYKAYYNYVVGDKKYKRFIVDIHPVCRYMINEWPSYKAKLIRNYLKDVFHRCLDYSRGKLDENMICYALDEGYKYHRRYTMGTHFMLIIETVMLDIIHEMFHSLGVTEFAEEDDSKEYNILSESRTIAEDTAGQIDWQKETHNFDFDVIKSIVENIGKTNKEKKIIIQAIYKAMDAKGEMFNIPYTVDKLLDDLHKKYDENRRGLWDSLGAYCNYHVFNFSMEKKRHDNKESHTMTEDEIDEVYNSATNMLANLDTKNENDDVDSLIATNILPKEFETREAKQLMQVLVDAKLLTTDWQPQGLSISERGYLAGEIARRLKINAKWKVMGLLWNANPETLRQGNNRAFGQNKTGRFIDRIKELLG